MTSTLLVALKYMRVRFRPVTPVRQHQNGQPPTAASLSGLGKKSALARVVAAVAVGGVLLTACPRASLPDSEGGATSSSAPTRSLAPGQFRSIDGTLELSYPDSWTLHGGAIDPTRGESWEIAPPPSGAEVLVVVRIGPFASDRSTFLECASVQNEWNKEGEGTLRDCRREKIQTSEWTRLEYGSNLRTLELRTVVDSRVFRVIASYGDESFESAIEGLLSSVRLRNG